MSSLKEKQELLADAKTQYHLMRTGRQARVIVQENGERVEFSSPLKLKTYIDELQAEIASPDGSTYPRPAIGIL